MRSGWFYLLLLVASSVSVAEVYRSVDADGNVTYSDRLTGEDAETIFIDTGAATPTAASIWNGAK